MANEDEQPKPAAEEPAGKQDVVFVHSPSEHGYRVIRSRDDAVEVGELRPVAEGRPLHGDLVKLTPRAEHARLFDVEVVMEAPKAERAHGGPAQVATAAYRANWDAIFGPGDGEGGSLN